MDTSGLAELNSRGRLLFMANHPERFADVVVSEMIGLSDEGGASPFWTAVGENFFDIGYAEAEKLCEHRSRTFLAELMPHYPIYVPLLPDEAQEVMGAVHPRARVSFDLFIREGFETDRYIDIFDGGATLHAPTSSIRSIAASTLASVMVGHSSATGETYLVSNVALAGYRAVKAELAYIPGKPVMLSQEIANALQVIDGSDVRIVAL
jgi:arginine N-succinyltransferase